MNNHLEIESLRFKEAAQNIILSRNEEIEYSVGRPPYMERDILICLLLMSYRSCSYRRIHGDLIEAQLSGLIESIPSKSTLNRFMLRKSTTILLQELISLSAIPFSHIEDTVIVDSSWLAKGMYVSSTRHHLKKNISNQYLGYNKTRKIHVCLLRKSRAISAAIPSPGNRHDSLFFQPLIRKTIDSGFELKKVLADRGYLSKEHYAFLESLNINEAFICFKKSCTKLRNGRGALYKKQLNLFRYEYDKWFSEYRFRPLIENFFSSWKRKFRNYIASRNVTAMDNELLLRILVHNVTIVGKFA